MHVRSWIIVFVFVLGSLGQGVRAQSDPRVILVILAHPDDETTMGGVLAKLAEDSQVFLVVAADGRYGVTDHANIPAGDSLAAVRAREAACSCERLGIEAPILLGLHDEFGSRDGLGEYFRQSRQMRVDLVSILEAKQPDLVITFGQDGDTGHFDHRMVGAITTKVFLQRQWSWEMSLYYFAWSPEQAAMFEGWRLGHTDTSNLSTVIEYSPEHEAKAMASIRCYVSQYSTAEMEDWIQLERRDAGNHRFFRRLEKPEKLESGF